MLHLFIGNDPWFPAKKFGYGAGLPFKWQGWALLLSHMAVIIGVAFLLKDSPMPFVPLALFIALAPMPIYAAHTEGKWKWRWGDQD